jgi:hypothetical protein
MDEHDAPPVAIPILPRTSPPIYRTDRGRVCADWRVTDWLRAWLKDDELWALLESLAPRRLRRFGYIVQAQRDADVDQ